MHTIESYQKAIGETIVETCRHLGATDYSINELAISSVPDTAFGDIAINCFGLRERLGQLPQSAQKNPAAIASALAEALNKSDLFDEVRAVGPYVNMSYNMGLLSDIVISQVLAKKECFANLEGKKKKIIIEFSGPNTNKPQHLGHLRNNVIGESMSRILKAAGYELVKVNIINDRGIHICKSMVAYLRHGNGENPTSANKKGDHLIGDYYVQFDRDFQAEFKAWLDADEGRCAYEAWKDTEAGQKAQKAIDAYEKLEKKKGKVPAPLYDAFVSAIKDSYFNDHSELGKEATDLLLKWEDGDVETLALWKKLNQWVLDGFAETYKSLGIEFDKLYFESETYKLGKDIIYDGLERGVFHRLPDGAIAFDLTKMGLTGDKIVLRSNATSVYITQDIGTAKERYKDFGYDKMIYVVADEQNHHFKVLFAIMGELFPDLANRFEHLSYGMVTLPHGRMKSREGTVVDTDTLIVEMTDLVSELMDNKEDKEHYETADRDEIQHRTRTIALAALKYYLLDVTANSWLEFNPEKSLDLQGRTGAYALMNYARTRSILRKAHYVHRDSLSAEVLRTLQTPQEKRLLIILLQFSNILNWAAESRDPAKLAEHIFTLCKAFAFIFTDKVGHAILTCPDPKLKEARLALVDACGIALKTGLNLLGIDTLEEI